MYKLIFLICAFFMASGHGLVPLKGLIKGDVREVRQTDPLEGLFSKGFYRGNDQSESQRAKIEMQKAVYSLGANLANKCSLDRFYTYDSPWSEETAKRSIVAALQYTGIDLASKALAKYAKEFKLEEKEYENLVDNLVTNTCSDNITVYSKKLIRNNLLHLWEKGSGFEPPSFGSSPYVAEALVKKTESYETKQREFNFAVRNFRDFCSWNGDVDNYRMLAPYLRNPFLMGMVNLNLMERKLEWDPKEKTVNVVKAQTNAMVACEDLVCRQRSAAAFHRLFPRMVGSVDLKDDLEVLYCEHFRESTLKTAYLPEKIKGWINEQSLEESVIAPMNFVAMWSGVPDFILSAETYEDLAEMQYTSIEEKWDAWAEKQTDQLVLDLLYEESLYVDLAKASLEQEALPSSGLIFDFTLGELDRELKVVDKLTSEFSLSIPESYLAWLKRAYIAANNKSDYAEMKNIREKFKTYLNVQLADKKKYFETPVWNQEFAEIISNEMIRRLTLTDARIYQDLSQKLVEIPIKFRFGLFAMKYFRDKFQAKSRLAP